MLKLISPPDRTPVSLAEMRAHLRITSCDEDDVIEQCLAASVAALDGDGEIGRAMISQGWSQRSRTSCGRIILEMTPALSVSQVVRINADLSDALVDPSEYRFDLDSDEPSIHGLASGTYRVEYEAGFGPDPWDIPANLTHAVKLLAAHLFEVREMVVIGTSVSEIPVSVERLIAKHRRILS